MSTAASAPSISQAAAREKHWVHRRHLRIMHETKGQPRVPDTGQRAGSKLILDPKMVTLCRLVQNFIKSQITGLSVV